MSARETMKEVIGTHNLLSLATLDEAGGPCVRTVDFAAGEREGTLYFITRKDSRKIKQIRANPKVAFAIARDCPDWEQLRVLKYVKGTATAVLIDDPQEMQQAFGLLMRKFPFLKNLPGDPADFAGVRLDLKEVLVTDNAIFFGNTETIRF